MKHLAIAMALSLATTGSFAQTAEPQTRVTKELASEGVKDCIPQVDRWVKFIEPDDGAYAYETVYKKDAPNGGLATVTLVDNLSDGEVVTTLHAIPTASKKCDVAFTVMYGQPGRSCSELREKDFKDLKFSQTLGTVVVLEADAGPAEELLLTPLSNGGCQVVRRVTAFDE
jgi:hypothetical protein